MPPLPSISESHDDSKQHDSIENKQQQTSSSSSHDITEFYRIEHSADYVHGQRAPTYNEPQLLITDDTLIVVNDNGANEIPLKRGLWIVCIHCIILFFLFAEFVHGYKIQNEFVCNEILDSYYRMCCFFVVFSFNFIIQVAISAIRIM
jgi:hypothetical protein